MGWLPKQNTVPPLPLEDVAALEAIIAMIDPYYGSLG